MCLGIIHIYQLLLHSNGVKQNVKLVIQQKKHIFYNYYIR